MDEREAEWRRHSYVQSRPAVGEPETGRCEGSTLRRQTPRSSDDWSRVDGSRQYMQVHKSFKYEYRSSSEEESLRRLSHATSNTQRRSRSRQRTPRRLSSSSTDRKRQCRRFDSSCSSDGGPTVVRPARRRRHEGSKSDDGYTNYRDIKRNRTQTSKHRSRSRSRSRSRARSRSCVPVRNSENKNRSVSRELDEISESSHNVLNKFIDILNKVNIVPEFDPLSKEQTIETWISKVEESAKIYGWDERQIIHFALPKLTGIAKTWYQGLDSVLFSWSEWKRKLCESFPCKDDYAELLTAMLAKRARYGECLEEYYYAKINLLNRCGITGSKAVDCLLHGIDDRAVRFGATAARFTGPADLLKYLKTVKVDDRNRRNTGDRQRHDRSNAQNTYANARQRQDRSYAQNPNTNANKPKSDAAKKVLTCFNCNEEGHKSFKCTKTRIMCSICNKKGHIDVHCKQKQATTSNN